MRVRDILIPFVTGVVIFGMSAFLSCASQDRLEEGDDLIDGGEESTITEGAPPQQDAPPTKAPPSEEASAENLGELGELPQETTAENKDAAQETPPAENLEGSEALPPAEEPPAGENVASNELPSIEENAPPTAKELPPSEPPATEPPADATVAANEPPPLDATVPKSDVPVRSAVGFSSKVPQIPANAIQRGNVALNRFYFARQGDTAQSISQLIYGDTSRAKDIQKWNKGGISPGRLVYYSSADQPQDDQMKSLYQERNVAPEEYVVQKGDWLSRIAAKKLGSAASWKEIAVVNGIERPNSIEPGQRLAVYPVELPAGSGYASDSRNGKAKQQEMASSQNAVGYEAPTSPSAIEVPSQPAQDPVVQAETPPAAPTVDPMADAMAKRKAKKKGGFDFVKLIEQNLFFIVLGAGVAVLVLALIAVNKRRKARVDGDLGEDGFAPARAKRR